MVGGDPNTDVALIKINANNLPAAYMGNSDSVKIGEWVMAVGSPLNFRSTITAGIVSALGRDIRIIDRQYSVENFIQTDAVINPGNSGGALVNLKGEVIGVNTAIATRTGLYQGYGFAIPINLAKKIVEDVVEFGEVKRGLLGVSISPVTNLVARGVGLPQPKGVLIQSLTEGSAAEKSSLKPGDVILSVNDIEVNSVNDLQIKIAQKRPGERVKLKVWRDKSERIFFVKLGIAPASVSENIKSEERKTKPHKNLGISFRDLTKQEKNRFDTDIGVYIEDIKAGSPAREGGIYPGSIILSINDQTIENKDDLEKMISKIQKGQVVKFLVRTRRSNQETFDRILFVEKE
jgi:serine protease Do